MYEWTPGILDKPMKENDTAWRVCLIATLSCMAVESIFFVFFDALYA